MVECKQDIASAPNPTLPRRPTLMLINESESVCIDWKCQNCLKVKVLNSGNDLPWQYWCSSMKVKVPSPSLVSKNESESVKCRKRLAPTLRRIPPWICLHSHLWHRSLLCRSQPSLISKWEHDLQNIVHKISLSFIKFTQNYVLAVKEIMVHYSSLKLCFSCFLPENLN